MMVLVVQLKVALVLLHQVFANLIDGGTDIGADLVDADEIIVDDGGGGTTILIYR